ncbi:hypothetical protein Tco_0655904 [Tanacetum coccineum]|uniref:Reverse transcriptase domain-containing protein n=1 Tax=Tanacetum coccineum TaxID=301880 RepID=A0ABQ4X8F5_9ASTR
MRIHGIAKVELASCEWGRSLRVMGLFDGAVVQLLHRCRDLFSKGLTDPFEIHHIKQREGESTEDFVRRFKTESRDVKGAPENEMWKITTSFLRGEVAAGNQERKKTFPP